MCYRYWYFSLVVPGVVVSVCVCVCVFACRAGELRVRWRVWMVQVGMGNAEHQGALKKGEVLPRPASSQSEVRILPSEPAPSWEQPMRFHCSFPTELFQESLNKILSLVTHPYVILKPYDFIYEHDHLGMTRGQVNDDRTVISM